MTSAGLALPPEPSSVPAARAFVCRTLEDWGMTAVCDAAEMLVSELATNAVLHARTAFEVEVSRAGDAVRVCVRDASTASPRTRRYGADSTTGRGLRLVDTLATCWGVEQQADGKVVWFEVPASGEDRPARAWDDEDGSDLDALLAAFPDEDPPAQITACAALPAAA